MCRVTFSPQVNDNNVDMRSKQHTPLSSSSALRRMTPFIISGYVVNTILYLSVKNLLPSTLVADEQYCLPNDSEESDGRWWFNNNNNTAANDDCDRRDLFSFQIVSLVNLSCLGLLGVYTFYITKRTSKVLPQTPQGRYFGNSANVNGDVLLKEADYINAVIVIFQGWDFITSLFFDEHCTMIMMTHHALAFICGFFCLVYDVNPYYAVYFGGVSEFSSIFLCISQLFQYYPPSSLSSPDTTLSTILHTLESFCQAMFVLTFFIFRIIGWATYSYMFIRDSVYILKNGLVKRFSPGSGWFLWYLLSMAVLLGGLQVYWCEGIVKKLGEIHG